MRNFAFPGYAKHVSARSAIRAKAPVGAELERPPPSGDRWLRSVDPNRLLPSRCKATIEAGLDASKPGRLYRCRASVAAH